MTQNFGKAVVEGDIPVVARNGTWDDLAVNLASAAMGLLSFKPQAPWQQGYNLEEFLHNTQLKLGLLEKYGSYKNLAVHVKDFMLRHVQFLGLDNPHDIRLLQKLKVEEIQRLSNSKR